MQIQKKTKKKIQMTIAARRREKRSFHNTIGEKRIVDNNRLIATTKARRLGNTGVGEEIDVAFRSINKTLFLRARWKLVNTKSTFEPRVI